MNKSPRYSTALLPESQVKPSSNDLGLKNKLEIMSPNEMDRGRKNSVTDLRKLIK